MQLTLARPDDWHLHLRDGATLSAVAAHSARQFGRAVIMPNLTPPVTTAAQALSYRKRILAALPADLRARFEPLMTLYLTDQTGADEIARAKASGAVVACKLYPAGATTNSAAGVTALEHIYPALEALTEHELPLLIHGEATDPAIDIFDREAVFIERVLEPLLKRFDALRVVLEHITTSDAAAFVSAGPDRLAATITPQHLLYSRNALFQGGLRPHYYCLPVLKRDSHREALVTAATSGSGKFFLGTDSAPHARSAKESDCGCAGCYSAPYALALYAEAFERAGSLDRLEGFSSHFGADFYRLPRSQETITLRREGQTIAERFTFGDDELVPLAAGEPLNWTFVDSPEFKNG